LKGPIPLDWLSAAARLPGKSLHVGIALWFLGGLQKSRVVSLSNIASLRFGLDRNAKYRALAWLEEAGLVSVERKLGRAPIVSLNDASSSRPLEPAGNGI
jgi:DNA-binding transcriptional ArsR family regulator